MTIPEQAVEAAAQRLTAAALKNERDVIANKAREWAANYSAGSDGRNTFVLLAEWIEAREAAVPPLVGVERAAPPLRAREEIAEINERIESWHNDERTLYPDCEVLEFCDLVERALSSTAGQEWRDILPRVIVHLEDGEGHDEGAFDESCDTCLLLRDLRALLPAPLVAEQQTGAE